MRLPPQPLGVEHGHAPAPRFDDAERWARLSILNVARSGKFSSDRAIREYCAEIWKVSPMSISASMTGGNT